MILENSQNLFCIITKSHIEWNRTRTVMNCSALVEYDAKTCYVIYNVNTGYYFSLSHVKI